MEKEITQKILDLFDKELNRPNELMEYVQVYRTMFLIHRKNPTPQNKRVLKAAGRDVLKFIEMEM